MSDRCFQRRWMACGRVLRIGDWSCLTILPQHQIGDQRIVHSVDRANLRHTRKAIENGRAPA